MRKNRMRALTLAIVAGTAAFLVTVSAMAIEPADGSKTRFLRVKCDAGESLARALKRARPGQTIRISGTCTEAVSISTDSLRLLGEDGATIDGSMTPAEGVVVIDGARGVILENLTVQNGSDQGVLVVRQSQATLVRVTATRNSTVGLSVDRSHIDIEDVTLDNNGTGGMDAYTGSTVVAKGNISASENGGDGLAANGKTFLELRGATIQASRNLGSGVSVINDSRLQIFSFPEAQGSRITADDNGFAGIGLLGAELGVVGSQFFGSGANVIEARNNSLGFFMPAGAILSPHATARFVAEGNDVGMVMEDGASALIIGGLAIAGNGVGISANGAGTLTLVSVPPNPSSVNGNEFVDIQAYFGTRITIDGVDVPGVVCDETVLVRGSVGCLPGS